MPLALCIQYVLRARRVLVSAALLLAVAAFGPGAAQAALSQPAGRWAVNAPDTRKKCRF